MTIWVVLFLNDWVGEAQVLKAFKSESEARALSRKTKRSWVQSVEYEE